MNNLVIKITINDDCSRTLFTSEDSSNDKNVLKNKKLLMKAKRYEIGILLFLDF